MADKPGDFYIGIIDFFGILVPRAILLYLHKNFALDYLGWFSPQGPELWVVFAVAAYVTGHFLMAASQVLNKFQEVFYPEKYDPYYKEVREKINLPADVSQNRSNMFYRAFAFVRLVSPSGLAEIERQMAEYKLFRSLTLVFALDFIFQVFLNFYSIAMWFRTFSSLLLCVAALWRFLYLLNWTRRITFEYCALLQSDSLKDKDKKNH